MRVEDVVRARLLAEIPNLRAFAHALTQDTAHADNLVQDTLVRAWSEMSVFERRTDLSARLFTTLRGLFYSKRRMKRQEAVDFADMAADYRSYAPRRQGLLDLAQCQKALATLSPRQREALFLVTAQGLSHEDAASICGVSTRTIKSRVTRGQAQLAQLLSGPHRPDIAPDGVTSSVPKPQAKSIRLVQ